MKQKEAEALALFVKDHDTRFLAKVMGEGEATFVQLTEPDGKVLEPVYTAQEYHQRYLKGRDPGPTIRTAWEKWQP